MCGIIGAVTHTPVNQLLYDGLLLLQHRGQDAAGIVTSEGPVFHMYKGAGYVRDVFRTRNMRELSGNAGIGHCRYRGWYAIVAMNAGYGLLAFRDQFGIRPLIIGVNEAMGGAEYVVASESVALDALGFSVLRDVAPGEAIYVDQAGRFHSRQCADEPRLSPCIFEFVYLARPASVMDGTSVYEARLRMGGELAKKIAGIPAAQDIDVVIPIPDTSRPYALELANTLGLKYREGFVKNRYIGRTFIMPGQAIRKKSVRQKLNPMGVEFKDKVVLLVDDSIVRGTTSREIVSMAREAGARKVYFASASPPVRYPNVYGINMPDQLELGAARRGTQIPFGGGQTGFLFFEGETEMSDSSAKRGFTTAILHSDRDAPVEHGSLHKPLHLSVAYGYRDARELAAVFQGRAQGYAYGRQGNPTAAALEEKVNRMEDGIGTVCFGTGMAAIGAIMLALLRNGDHVVASSFLFGNTNSLFNTLAAHGNEVTF